MRIAYFDCFSGISGDMTLAALIDAGVNAEEVKERVASLDLPAELKVARVQKGGFRATKVLVDAPAEHGHRHLHQIDQMVDSSRLSSRQKDLAKRIFRRLAEAEATVHGSSIEKVHFHEVGAIDSIVDIVGAAVAIDLLGAERITASPVPTGCGTVQAAHGVMPVPAPGTAELLKGVPLASSMVQAELTTPTGAAILTTVAEQFGPLPEIEIEAIGYGAGGRDLAEQPNLLRIFVGNTRNAGDVDQVWVLETNLDDVPGEMVGHSIEQLLAAGALDVYTTPIGMKKNRPGILLSVLCSAEAIGRMEQILFRETGTFGIRRYPVTRSKLMRLKHTVVTAFGPVEGKLGWRAGEPPIFTPEHEACKRLAVARNLPLRAVYTAAVQAFDPSKVQLPPD